MLDITEIRSVGPALDGVGKQNGHAGFWGVVPFVVVLAVWWVVGRLQIEAIRYVIPPPEAVVSALWKDITIGDMLRHIGITLSEIFWGLLIAAISALALGTAIGLSPFLERMLYPMIVFFQAIPKVALAPLWLIVFGFGIGSKVALAAMVAFFPLLVGVIVGLAATRRDEFELMRSLRATRWQIFRKVQVPRAMPSIFGGLEVGVLFALIGAVVGEFVGAQGGLGYLIQFRSAQLDVAGIFSPLIMLSLIGLALDLAAKWLGHRTMGWQGD